MNQASDPYGLVICPVGPIDEELELLDDVELLQPLDEPAAAVLGSGKGS